MDGGMMTDEDILHKERLARDYLSQLINEDRIPGIQYVVVDDQSILFELTGGKRDISANLPVTSETTFMASSSTKVLTACAVLQLIERGKVELDSSLSAYYSYHPYGARVTIRHLLNHTSGIPNPLPLKWLHKVENHAAFHEENALEKILQKNAKLAFTPGDKYSYSNISYWLLGKVIEETSGLSYCDYLRRHICAPLGISQGGVNCLITDPFRHARGYQKKYSMLGILLPFMMDKTLLDATEEGWVRLSPVYMNGPAYGGLIGTARGFSQFLQDQLRVEPLLVSSETRRLFFSHQRNSKGQELETALGWHRGQLSGIKYYGKPGGGPGFQSNVRVYPARNIATVWFLNKTGISEKAINTSTDSVDRYFV
jgi:CubicO group peptidase (beta-lactamase class C family)